MGENGRVTDAAQMSRLPLRVRLGKDVSVGEYDCATGLTYVTRQRGRLHFNMGANAIKQAHAAATETAAPARSEGAEDEQQDAGHDDTAKEPSEEAGKLPAPHLRTGAFTGLALYPEEAYYLLQRGALVIYKLEQPSSRATASNGSDGHQELQSLSVAHFVALLLRNQRASLACLDVYVCLKENKFHPRRHQEDTAATPTTTVADARDATVATPPLRASLAEAAATASSLSQPQHYNSASADPSCQFAYDVWKSSTETVYIPNEDHKPTTIDGDVEDDVKAAISEKSADSYGKLEELRSHEAEEPEQAPRVKPSLPPPPAAAAPTSAPSTYMKRKKDTSVKKRKVKRLRLVFRVVVCRFADVMPQPRELAELAATSGPHAPLEVAAHVPVKIAVVDQDKSVLFFEVGG